MLDDLNKSVVVVTVWLEELHALAVRLTGLVVCPAALASMVGQAFWFYLFVLALTVGRIK